METRIDECARPADDPEVSEIMIVFKDRAPIAARFTADELKEFRDRVAAKRRFGMYTLDDAQIVYYKAMASLGGSPDQLSRHGWEEHEKDDAFVWRDDEGDLAVKVKFTSNDGDAVVQWRGQEPVTANIWDNDDEEEAEEEGVI